MEQITFSIDSKLRDTLNSLKKECSLKDDSEVIQKAIATYFFFKEEIKNGNKVKLYHPDTNVSDHVIIP